MPEQRTIASGAQGRVRPASAAGAGLGGLEYAGMAWPWNTQEWDTWLNDVNHHAESNHLGIVANGLVDHGAGSPHTVRVDTSFDHGNRWYGQVDYDGNTLEVRTNPTVIRPLLSVLTRTPDIPAILARSSAIVGLVVAMGGDFGDHDILTWNVSDQRQSSLTEPASIAHTSLPLFFAVRCARWQKRPRSSHRQSKIRRGWYRRRLHAAMHACHHARRRAIADLPTVSVRQSSAAGCLPVRRRAAAKLVRRLVLGRSPVLLR